jgi:hypothetical protein
MSDTASEFTEKEGEITALLTLAFEGMDLRANTIDVHKLEGGMHSTVRFTVDERASADLERDRIATSGESAEALAEIVAQDLRGQLEEENR